MLFSSSASNEVLKKRLQRADFDGYLMSALYLLGKTNTPFHCEDLGGNRGVESVNVFFPASIFISKLHMHPATSTDSESLWIRAAVGEN